MDPVSFPWGAGHSPREEAARSARVSASIVRRLPGLLPQIPEQAIKYHASLEKAFRFLAQHPKAGRERKEITPPARVHLSGVHIIIHVIEGNEDLLIVPVRHAP